VIADPARRGESLAGFYQALEPRLFADLEDAGLLTTLDGARARREWECFALYACVRGLVAAGGFNVETGAAIDAFHHAVLATWNTEPDPGESFETRRTRVSERYSEYGAIGQDGGAAGAATLTERLGTACARHLCDASAEPAGLASLLGTTHEALAEGAAEAVRIAE
jgi:hypothetical protein